MKTIKEMTTIGACFLLLLFGLWIGCEFLHAKTSNPEGITSFTDYLSELPAPIKMEKWTLNSSNYFAFFGPIRLPLALPSGSPVYVFDNKGNMIDWTPDHGEDATFNRIWSRAQVTKLPLDQFTNTFSKSTTQ